MSQRHRPPATRTQSPASRLAYFRETAPQLEAQLASKDNDQVRAALCECLADYLLSFVTEAVQDNVPDRLWRHCFYPRIQLLRNKLNKAKRDGRNPQKYQETLGLFLSEAVTFYDYLQEKLEDHDSHTSLVETLHKVHLCLGDLWRYSGLLDKASRHYHQAFELQPEQGHSMNQLAVVAQLQQKYLVSCVWYLRALACASPFATSGKNLERLLHENQALLQQTAKRGVSDDWGNPQVCLLQFVDLYRAARVGEVPDWHDEWFERLTILLNKSKLSDKVLLQMLVVWVQGHTEGFFDGQILAQWGTRLAQRAEQLVPRQNFKILSPLLLLVEYLEQKGLDDVPDPTFWEHLCYVHNEVVALPLDDVVEDTILWDYKLLQGYLPLANVCGTPTKAPAVVSTLGDASTTASTSPDQNRAKVARFLKLGHRLASCHSRWFYLDGQELRYHCVEDDSGVVAMDVLQADNAQSQIENALLRVESPELQVDGHGVDENRALSENETFVYQPDESGGDTALLVPGGLTVRESTEKSTLPMELDRWTSSMAAPTPDVTHPPPGFAPTAFDRMWNENLRTTMNPFATNTPDFIATEAISTEGTPLLDTSLFNTLFSDHSPKKSKNPFAT